jgi:hypothetical protein
VYYGNKHAYIIDDGDFVFVESPHGYVEYTRMEHEGLLINNAFELATAFGDFRMPEFKYDEIKDINDPLIVENTLGDYDERWGANDFYVFETKEKFFDLMAIA